MNGTLKKLLLITLKRHRLDDKKKNYANAKPMNNTTITQWRRRCLEIRTQEVLGHNPEMGVPLALEGAETAFN